MDNLDIIEYKSNRIFRMHFNIKKNKEFIWGLLILWLVIVILLINSLILTKGHLIYSLDDAYIHMAIAKNFSQYGVWGITRFEFSSSSSSLLYSLLLSLIFLIFGPNEVAPFVINLVFANLVLYIVYYILKIKNNLPPYAVLVALISTIFFLPLPLLIFMGMEHTMQVFINITFVYIASIVISDKNLIKRKNFLSQDKRLIFFAPLVTMIRFEGMFLIIAVSFLLFFRKKIIYSIIVGISGFLPIIIYGIISISFGWFFFPNSIVLKSQFPDFFSTFLYFEYLSYNPHILILLLGAFLILYIQFFKKKEIWNNLAVISIIFIIISLFQFFFGVISFFSRNFSRYDSHLVAIGLVMIFLFIKNELPRNLSIEYIRHYLSEIKNDYETYTLKFFSVILLALLFFVPFIYRAQKLIEYIPTSTKNIYEQQYQMGLFLKKYYNGKCVAANDIGAINYIADIECLDLRGLGSRDTANYLVNDDLDEDNIYNLARKRDCKIAIIYEDAKRWFDIPTEWVKVGEWTIEDNVICYFDTVSFWAVDPDEVDHLMDHLRDFSKYLPNSVSESGNYTES